MAKKPKGGKIHAYFREFDKDLYDEIMQESKEQNKPPSQVLIDYARMGAGRRFEETEMLCERCGSSLDEL